MDELNSIDSLTSSLRIDQQYCGADLNRYNGIMGNRSSGFNCPKFPRGVTNVRIPEVGGGVLPEGDAVHDCMLRRRSPNSSWGKRPLVEIG